MQGEFIKGDIFDICAFLEREASKHKGMTVGEWLSLRKRQRQTEAELDELYQSIKKGDDNE